MPRKARSKAKSGAGGEDLAGDASSGRGQASRTAGGGAAPGAAAVHGGGLQQAVDPRGGRGGGGGVGRGGGSVALGAQIGGPPGDIGGGRRGQEEAPGPAAAVDPGFVAGPGNFPAPPQVVAGRGGPAGRGRYVAVGGAPPQAFAPAPEAAPPAGSGTGTGTGIGVPVAAPCDPTVTSLVAAVGQLQVQPAVSTKKLHFPARPSLGTLGRKFMVRTNHFFVEIVGEENLNLYHVEITPKVISRGLNRMIIRRLVEVYANDLGNRLPVYDGRSSLFTSGLLPFDKQDFQVVLPDENPGPGPGSAKLRSFKVCIKHAARVDLNHLNRFLAGKQADAPQEALMALDIVLRELPSRRYTSIGRSLYSQEFGQRDLGAGLVGWRGFFQSVRPTQMGLSLNVNVSATALLQPLRVLEFLDKHLSARRMANFSRGFNVEQKREVLKALRGIKVEVTHRGDQRRKYRINKLTDKPTRSLEFQNSDGKTTSVCQYFLDTYGCKLQYPDLPCLEVGSGRINYLPMEVCRIVAGQRYLAKNLGDQARTALLDMTSQRPHERQNDVLQIVKQNRYGEDIYAREFGMKISEQDTALNARLLDPPILLYKTANGNGLTPMQVSAGAWNMNQKRFVDGGKVKSWACVNFNSRLDPYAIVRFCQTLAQKCNSLGMEFNPQPELSIQNLNAAPADLKAFLKRCPGGGIGLDLLIAVFPDFKTDWYGDLKRICETEVGVISQCCWTKHVLKCQDQYMANVALKINTKRGGRNTVLRDAMDARLPTLGKSTTIIFGADVTHPSPGEDSVPSIAAVVASQDWPQVTTYAGLVRAQTGRLEIIVDLRNMVVELLKSFYLRVSRKPEVILFYRDGVSEGQFNQVLGSELTAIQQACGLLDQQYRPRITFVVVQKRHHTRFFPVERLLQSGNVMAGTVVDTKICHPREFDFYLCSHAGILGTSRPAHYHVLWDDNSFTADSLQSLTNSLCSTYARCTRSVSIVPPAYYAHHLATRARIYMGPGGSTVSEVHARIKPTMFYC